MKRSRYHHSKGAGSSGTEINVSPLIDIIFILLIFFVVTTVFVEQTGVQVNKPMATTSDKLKNHSILIAVTSEDQVYQGGRIIGIEGVRPVVSALLESDSRMPVIIEGDRSASHGTIVKVIDAAELAGAKNVYVASSR